MKKFFHDVISTLYATDGAMSIFRLAFFLSFFVFMAIAVSDFCTLTHHFDHYSELSIFVGSMGGLCCGNKLVDIKSHESGE